MQAFHVIDGSLAHSAAPQDTLPQVKASCLRPIELTPKSYMGMQAFLWDTDHWAAACVHQRQEALATLEVVRSLQAERPHSSAVLVSSDLLPAVLLLSWDDAQVLVWDLRGGTGAPAFGARGPVHHALQDIISLPQVLSCVQRQLPQHGSCAYLSANWACSSHPEVVGHTLPDVECDGTMATEAGAKSTLGAAGGGTGAWTGVADSCALQLGGQSAPGPRGPAACGVSHGLRLVRWRFAGLPSTFSMHVCHDDLCESMPVCHSCRLSTRQIGSSDDSACA